MNKPLDFWATKHAIDTEIKRLRWSKQQGKDYIKKHYDKSSRLTMTDEQLLHLLDVLRNLPVKQITSRKLIKRLGLKKR